MQPDFPSTFMPSVFVPEDGKWIQEQLNRLPVSMHHKVTLMYAERFQESFDAEPLAHKQQNAGCRNANTRLRLYV